MVKLTDEKHWQPCEYPERLPDLKVSFHNNGCRPCMIALHAWMMTMCGPDKRLINSDTLQWHTAHQILEEAGLVLPLGARR